MLNDLATVDWAALSAADVPHLLRAVAGGDRDALGELSSRLCPGGVPGDAAAAAVPFLIRLLDAPAAGPHGVLVLLTAVADAHAQRSGTGPRPTRARIAGQRAPVAAARAAVTAGLPSYLRLLAAHPDDDVRVAAATLVGALGPEVAGGASAGLRTASVTDRAELVRAAAVLALGARAETADDRLADPAPVVRLAAALVLAGSDAEAPLPGPVVQIVERDAPAALGRIPLLPSSDDDPLIWVLRALRPRGDLQVRLVTGWLRHPDAAVRAGAAYAAGEPLTTWPPAAALLAGPLAEASGDPAGPR
ncbi:hypothetical protein [Actinoplanes teichomyceticus]|uniref:HEAT repeat protein n=1 Tax=Actinoplanes teichomyceticus TaxID=1867 RepID=A0A561WC67_ACTTI|nr:hypothetical protein [Actinoplanes teichomyceticus]TWG21462.1 hypothetical protein FHX34_1031001 [Actinoplanes teichomyceticus]GIF16564.1 hypothetical protein Ate01nite_65960 [Actinoplanes teichomyceticus]